MAGQGAFGPRSEDKSYEYATATVRGGRRATQREAARLVKLASEGRHWTERETLGGLWTAGLDHIEARGRAPKTLLENRRLATAIYAELGEKELRKVTGRDLDAFYDRLPRVENGRRRRRRRQNRSRY